MVSDKHSAYFMAGTQKIFVIKLIKYIILLNLLICINFPKHPEHVAGIYARGLF